MTAAQYKNWINVCDLGDNILGNILSLLQLKLGVHIDGIKAVSHRWNKGNCIIMCPSDLVVLV
jgi:hypothetical protein